MAGLAGKRKREEPVARQSAFKKSKATTTQAVNGKKTATLVSKSTSARTKDARKDALQNGNATNGHSDVTLTSDLSIQVVTGSYERVLHGFVANIPQSLLQDSIPNEEASITYTDTFLFAAHTSSIRCLAISPSTENSKRFLATGGADERINLYNLSAKPPSTSNTPNLPSLTGAKIVENSTNQSLGSLIHHDRALARLRFPTKGKLFSAAEDNTVGITRTRDWTVLSTLKAPIPKQQGRPSGDTAAPGEVPTGVNDFAIHPSEKLMLSVSRGERCMRLWNLMTGKKAGVLNFSRETLKDAGEGKHSSGEGRRVLWDPTGQNFIVGFERGVVLFTQESKPVCVMRPEPSTKLHQMHFLPGTAERSILAIATEDGRVLLCELITPAPDSAENATPSSPSLTFLAQIGGKAADIGGRIKDFEVLPLPSKDGVLVIAASSDGAVRFWKLKIAELNSSGDKDVPQVGTLLSTHETGNRITCLGAFAMEERKVGAVEVADDEGEE